MNATHVDRSGRNYARVVVDADGDVLVWHWPKSKGTTCSRPAGVASFAAKNVKPDGSIHGWTPIVLTKGDA